MLLAAVVSKPKPLMVIVVALAADGGGAAGHDGRDRGHLDCRAAADAVRVVTTAVRLPAVVGLVENVTVSEVAVAAVTVPTAPSLKVDRVVAGRRVEAKAVDGDRGRVGGQVGRAGRYRHRPA